MPWEAIFEVSKSDGFAERLTEGSGGSHLSAGIATNSVLMDIVGGSSNEATAPLLPADILAHLPPFFFCQEYLSSLAVCSRYCLERVLDRLHWSKSHLDLETPEFQRNRNALRSMSRWWKAARSITISQHQLTLLDDIPQNCLLRWTAFDYPSRDDQSSGYRSVHSLLGCARFNITLPSHVRKLQVGVENPRGPEAVCMNIYELFTERMSVSFRVIPLARAYTPRKSPLPDGILIPDSTNQVMIMWDRRYFTAYINNYILGPVSLDTETAPGPPSQACPFVWTESARRALRHPQVFMQPTLSPVMPRAECICRICLQSNWLESRTCVACPTCSAWICKEHVTQMPHAECPGCPARLSDYFGGSDLSVIATDFLNSVYIDVTIDHKSYQTRLAHFWQTVHGLKHFIQEHPYSLLILPHPEKSDDIFYNSLEVIYLLTQSIQRQDVQGVYKHFSLNHAPIMMKNPWLFQMLPIGSPVAAIDLIWQRAAVRSEIMCNLLADFPTYHYDAECSRIAFQIPAEPGLVVRCRAASEPDFSGGSSRALDSDIVNRILQFYNAASQGTAASLSLTRSCLGESRIRNKIIAYCIPAVPHDCFWAESIAHAVNNCASFTANHILRHPEPIRFFQLYFKDDNTDSRRQ